MQLTPEELINVLLASNNNMQTAWHLAADWFIVEALAECGGGLKRF